MSVPASGNRLNAGGQTFRVHPFKSQAGAAVAQPQLGQISVAVAQTRNRGQDAGGGSQRSVPGFEPLARIWGKCLRTICATPMSPSFDPNRR